MLRSEGTIVTFDHEGEQIRFFVKDPTEEIQKYHYAGGFYEIEELRIMQKYYRKGTIFADIGTNIGNHAVFADKILKAPEVIVFEPNPAAIDYMEINLALNNCRNINRQYLGFPISDRLGAKMTITLSPDNNLGNTVFGNSEDGTFRTITGDFALSHRPVGFIKVDTEYMEFETLAGLANTLKIWRPTVFLEALESREAELQAWCSANEYHIAEHQKRYELLRNYVLQPNMPPVV